MSVLNRDFSRGGDSCGRLRTGAEKTGRGPGRPLAAWRFTSGDERLLALVAQKFGGDAPSAWSAQGDDDLQVVSEASALRVAVVGLHAEWRLWASSLVRRCDGVTMVGDGAPCACPTDVYEMRVDAADGKACKPSIGLRVIVPLPGLAPEWRPWLLVSHHFDLAADLDKLYDEIAGLTGAPPEVQVDMRTDRDAVPTGWLRLETVRAQQPYMRPVLDLDDTVAVDRLESITGPPLIAAPEEHAAAPAAAARGPHSEDPF